MGEPHVALADAQDALVMARVLGADQRAGVQLALLASMAFNSGELSMGEAWLREAEALLKTSESVQDAVAMLHAARAREAWGLGRVEDAGRWWSECLRSRACWFLGAWHRLEAAVVFWRAGMLKIAREVVVETTREAHARGADHVMTNGLLLQAYIADDDESRGDASSLLDRFLSAMERGAYRFFPAADPPLVQWARSRRAREPARDSLSCGMPDAGCLGKTARVEDSPRTMGATLRISTLGPLRIQIGDREIDEDVWKSRMKAKRLLELILSSRSYRVSADEAVELLWPDARPGRGRHRLQCTASDLRRVLDQIGIGEYLHLRFRQPFYELAFDPGRVTISHEVFEQLSQEALAGPFNEESVTILRRAVALYLGEYLEDARYDRFTDSRRHYLAQRMGQILRALASGTGSPEEALVWWQQAVDHDPYDEEAYRGLIHTAHSMGRPERVAAGLAALRERIVDELGLPLPSWALTVATAGGGLLPPGSYLSPLGS
jgi:DNA-binding SARP family transcriptional activator